MLRWNWLKSSISAILDSIAVDTRRRWRNDTTSTSFTTTLKVLVLNVKGVNVAGKVSEDGQKNVDAKVCTTSCHQGDTNWRNYAWLVSMNVQSELYLLMRVMKIRSTMLIILICS